MNLAIDQAAKVAPAIKLVGSGLDDLVAGVAAHADDQAPSLASDRLMAQLLRSSAADAIAIRLFDAQAERGQAIAAIGFPAAYLAQIANQPMGMASRALRGGGAPILAPDLLTEPRLGSKSQLDYGFLSCAILPLQGSTAVRGVLQLASRRKGFFADADRDRWEAFAAMANIL